MEPRPDGQGSPRRRPVRNWPHLIGNLLLVAGAFSLFLAGFAYLTDPSRAAQSLPRPVALASATTSPTPLLPTATAVPTRPVPTSTPTVTPTPTTTPFKAGQPVRIVISSIGVDSKVQEIGTAVKNGQLIWETIPYIVGHYHTSAEAGQNGNAIFAGHVTSQSLGNVFLNLYKVELGDSVQIYTKDTIFTYKVGRVRLVLPTDTSVMSSTPNATATMITCAGDWIPSEHQYSRRLIVTATLVSAKPIN